MTPHVQSVKKKKGKKTILPVCVNSLPVDNPDLAQPPSVREMTHFKDSYKSSTLPAQDHNSAEPRKEKQEPKQTSTALPASSDSFQKKTFSLLIMCSRVFLTSLVVLLAFLAVSNGRFWNFRCLAMLPCLHLSVVLQFLVLFFFL